MLARFAAYCALAVPCFAGQVQFTYDSLNRLTRARYPDGTSIAYAYDSAGNRLSQVLSNPSIALPTIGADKTVLTFSSPAGQSSTATQTLTIRNTGGGALQWNASPSVPWISVAPGSGADTGAISVSASAAGLAAGSYSGSVIILASASNAPVSVPVVFTVTASPGSPVINSGGITSGAGFLPGVTRGSVASIFGTSLADAAMPATTVPLPRTLGSVQVAVNGVSAPLWYVDPGQINFQVPFEAPLQGKASVVVTKNGVEGAPADVMLTPYAPSVFLYQRVAGVFDPIIVHATTNQLITPSSPAVENEYVLVYGTGIGDLTVLPMTGELSPSQPLAAASIVPAVTVGGVPAKVTFAGLTPQSIGLAQFNVRIPQGLPSAASLPLVIAFGSAMSQPVQLYVAKTPASATALSDDFKGSAIDASKWNVAVVPAAVGTVTETNQRLEMQHVAPGVVSYLGLQSRWKLSGDFDVQVDYRLLNWPPRNLHTVRLSAPDLPAGPLGVVGLYRNSYNAEGYQMRTINGLTADIATSDMAGTLRLVRTGSTISGFRWDGSQFVLLGSSPTTTADTGITLDFASPNTTAPAGVQIAFENFRVNSGTIATGSLPGN